MQIGTPEHKAQFLQDLLKTYQENIWIEEIQLIDLDEMLGHLRTQLAEISLKLDRKEFKSASEGKKLREQKESEIEATQAAIEGLKAKTVGWTKRIELIKRYESA